MSGINRRNFILNPCQLLLKEMRSGKQVFQHLPDNKEIPEHLLAIKPGLVHRQEFG